MFPGHWLQFVEGHKLLGRSASVDEEADLSTLGAEMRFLTAAESIDELTNFWPGIGLAQDGFVPVASCLEGSGDYYYINSNDDPIGPLYRIYHDVGGPEGYDAQSAVVRVFDHYDSVLRYVEP